MKNHYKKEYFTKSSEKNTSIFDLYKYFLRRENILLDDKKIADFGCARGLFFDGIIDNNMCDGYDISSFAVDFCREKFKEKGSFKLFDLNNDQLDKNITYDVIALFDVIEHLDNFLNLKIIINNNLKSNEVLVLTTPNANSLLRFLLGNRNNTGELDNTHTMLFTPYTLDFFLRRSGLKKISLSTPYSFYFKNNWLTKLLPFGGQIFAIYKKC